MTTYTAISNTLVSVGAKPFASTIQALRDNPIAIAEGAAGAPAVLGLGAASLRSRLPVLTGLTAGTVSISTSSAAPVENIHHSGSFVTTTTNSTSFVSAGIITNVLLSGTVEFAAGFNTGGTTGEIRFLKNNTVVNTWTAGTGFFSVSVSVGDTFEWQIRRVGGTSSNNLTISSMSIQGSDAYTRIGMPIRSSDL
jgi:hypothetical protein